METIVILHPDLGIGGAERLILDAALALKQLGYQITIFTSHHDQNHCFEVTKNGELSVTTAGEWIPRSTFGRFKAFWAYLRMIYLSLYVIFNYKYDLVICDQISAGIPFFRLFKQKCLFYCHFPDLLLTDRKTLLKSIYRYPIDSFEEWTTGLASTVLVNSLFTAEKFYKTFKSLNNVTVKVLYPTIKFDIFDKKMVADLDIKLNNVETLFLSINRFERKKNLDLAIKSLKKLYDISNLNDKKARSTIHLILCGGFDPINKENIEYFDELIQTASKLDIEQNVTVLKSPSDDEKQSLLHSCTAVIYTPENEHFGIVPLEAMYMKRPVIAANSGGPRETVIDGETGFLCEPDPQSFAEAMQKFFKDKSLSREMGISGHKHVTHKFNSTAFKENLDDIVKNLLKN